MDMNLEEFAVIGNFLFPELRTASLVEAVSREDLRSEHFADTECRAAFEAIMNSPGAGRDPAENQRILHSLSGIEFAERAIAAADMLESNAVARIAKTAEEGRKRLIAEAVNAALLMKGKCSEAFLRAELHRIAEMAVKRGGKSAAKVESLADFLSAKPAPLDPIIEGCFEFGDKVELIAPSKCRKSFFAVDLALHVAAGKDFLALKVPRQRRVLYINLEIKSDWMKRRIIRRLEGYGLDFDKIAGNFMILNCRGRGEMMREQLPRFIAEAKAEFVVIDPRYKLMRPDENENSGEGLVGILGLLDDVAEMNAAVMVVSHDAKGDNSAKDIRDRGAGSSWAARDTDCRFTLTPSKQNPDNDIVLAVLPRNYPPLANVMLEAEDTCFVWNQNREVVTGKNAADSTAGLARLVELLRQCGIPMLKGTFADHLANDLCIGINRARAMIDEALVQGLIVEGRKSLPGAKKMLGFAEWFKARQGDLADTVNQPF